MVDTIDHLTAGLPDVLKGLGVTVALSDSSNRPFWGSVGGADARVIRMASETGLPMTLHVISAEPHATERRFSSRRNVLAIAFIVMAVVIAAAAFLVFRAVRREVDVARLQSDFLAAVSHEFRTPLSVMGHMTAMLEEGRQSPDRLPAYYRALAAETRRLNGLVEALLDFGRTEAGRREYRREVFDLGELVALTVREYTEMRGLAGQRIAAETTGHSWIDADKDGMALVIRNLVDNAVKYSPDTSVVDIRVQADRDSIALTIRDKGAGIPRAEQRNIFHRFVRGSAARELGVKGTGIGLAMAMHIVRGHQGSIHVTSEPGSGSCFTVQLPAASLPAGAHAVVDHP
jgi:two-component system phosphate regulon sensor histidine kinase PhoR